MLSPILLAFLATSAAETRITEPVSIFDGKSLAGWVTRGGRYDGNAEWTVEDGALVGRQNAKREGGLIYTARPYTEFLLTLECKLDRPFDSGIFLRMAPKGKGAQVTLDYRDGGEIGAIYSDGFLKHNPDGIKLWKHDEWNKVVVRSTGLAGQLRVVVHLNDALLVDYTLPEDASDFAPTGLIGLQVHGDRDDPAQNACRFRNIMITELSPTQVDEFVADSRGRLARTPWGNARGWKLLFDGRSLAGWKPAEGTTGFEVRTDEIALLTQGDSTHLCTNDDFKDFALRLDFKLAAMTNSGLFLRGDRAGGDPAWTGCEIQIIDDFNWEERTKTKLKPWQFTGSLYGSVAPQAKALKPLGEWNTFEIEYAGTRLKTVLNGVELYDVDTTTVSVPEGRLPFARRSAGGFIGLQRHAPEGIEGEAYAWFRNIWVRPLNP
ncbi:MAG: DUF1080 domain-containing protein [Planctomycetes bacterium]|nr:DUF1080 domain-containing protein [Planctomycetota bacterium]